LLGPNGGWKELNGRYPTHSRLVDACVSFNSKSRHVAHVVAGKEQKIRFCNTLFNWLRRN